MSSNFTIIPTTETDPEGFKRYGYDVAIDGEIHIASECGVDLDRNEKELRAFLEARGLQMKDATWR